MIVNWYPLVGALLLIGIVAVSYRLINGLRLTGESSHTQNLIYFIGLGLVLVPLATYWANFFGLPISATGVTIVLAILLACESIAGVFLINRRKRLTRVTH